MLRALELLRDETNEALPEGQLRVLVKDTLTQLEQFMKTQSFMYYIENDFYGISNPTHDK
jgi:hypothetical protein